MGRKPLGRRLNVFMNSRKVGQMRIDPSGAMSFQYDPTWLSWTHAMPVSLSLPLREDPYSGHSLFCTFDNLLPDDGAVRVHMAERVRAEGAQPYQLLAKVGRDCVGALQFLPDGEAPGKAGAIDTVEATEEKIAATIQNLGRAPLGVTEDENFRISIAGAQEKTALTRIDGKWFFPKGTTATTHILKPAMGVLRTGWDCRKSVENEWFCMTFLARFGLNVAHCEMGQFGEHKVLIVERFDREWTSDGRLLRRPQEDFCQILSTIRTEKYEFQGGAGISDVVDVLRSSDTVDRDIRDFFKSKVLYWLMAVADCHSKNYSVFLSPGGGLRLTPFYDVLSTQPNLDVGERGPGLETMAMAVNGIYEIDRITTADWFAQARKSGVHEAVVLDILDSIFMQVDKAVQDQMASLPPGFPELISASIVGGFQKRLNVLKAGLRPDTASEVGVTPDLAGGEAKPGLRAPK